MAPILLKFWIQLRIVEFYWKLKNNTFMSFIPCPKYETCYLIVCFYACCIVISFCCTAVFLLFRCFLLIVDVFPSILVCSPDLFSLNRFMTYEERYTTVAFIYSLKYYWKNSSNICMESTSNWRKSFLTLSWNHQNSYNISIDFLLKNYMSLIHKFPFDWYLMIIRLPNSLLCMNLSVTIGGSEKPQNGILQLTTRWHYSFFDVWWYFFKYTTTLNDVYRNNEVFDHIIMFTPLTECMYQKHLIL